MGSHSFTCHPYTNGTWLYSAAAERHRPLAGTYCTCPLRDGQAELTWVAGYIPRWMPVTGNWTRTRSPIPVLCCPPSNDRHIQCSWINSSVETNTDCSNWCHSIVLSRTYSTHMTSILLPRCATVQPLVLSSLSSQNSIHCRSIT